MTPVTEGYWLIKEDEKSYAPYKNEVLKEWQDALRARGITDKDNLQVFTAQAMQENGALSPTVIGDNGCSLGLPQRNFCSHAGISAKTALKKWPEWNNIKFQIAWFADNTKGHMDEYQDIKWAVIAHNCPACARKRHQNVYWKDVNSQKSILVWNN